MAILLEKKMKSKKKTKLEKNIVPAKKKKGVHRLLLGESRREIVGGIVLGIGLIFLIVTFILWGVSELIEENFIMSEMVGAYCGASMCLCFGLVFIGLIIGTRNWFGKIVGLLVAAVFMSVSYSFIETSMLLYKDKAAFESKQFEKLVAAPIGEEYDDPDYGTEFLMELKFNDLTIDVHNLGISRSYYEANLYGKSLEIAYLPNSRFAISVKEYLEVTGG
jgi:hypothetical protein